MADGRWPMEPNLCLFRRTKPVPLPKNQTCASSDLQSGAPNPQMVFPMPRATMVFMAVGRWPWRLLTRGNRPSAQTRPSLCVSTDGFQSVEAPVCGSSSLSGP
eukprot:19571-Chlamydomonas_euryale.AAC.8